MKRLCFFLTLLCALTITNARAQTDKMFWFAAPSIASGFNSPVYLRVTTLNKAAKVTISEPGNATFVPITQTIAANSNYSFDLTALVANVQNQGSDAVDNKGLLVESSENVQAYYEVSKSDNNDIFPLKGQNALGNSFIVPSMKRFTSGGYGAKKSMFYAIATENGTTITVHPSVDLVGHAAGEGSFTVNLDKGQVYCAEASGNTGTAHIGGTEVTSNKPIAITTLTDLTLAGSCGDLNGDQVIPVSLAGKKFITMPGYLNAVGGGSDFVYIYPTEDDTNIYINGTIVANANKGGYYERVSNNETLVIETNKPSLIYQVSGFGCEVGGGVVPQIECTGSTQVGVTRSTSENFFINILVKKGGEGTFKFNGNAFEISAGDFVDVPNTNGDYKFAQKLISTESLAPDAGAVISAAVPFHLGVVHGGPGSGCRYGYFSNFAAFSPEVGVSNGGTICTAQGTTSILTTSFVGTSYQWKKDGVIIPGANSTTYTANAVGDYSVDVEYDAVCALVSSEIIKVIEKCAAVPPGGVADNLVLWLDASDPNADGVLPAPGDLLTSWKDRSPAENHASVVAGKNAAAFTPNQMNGKPVLNFTRVNDNLGSMYYVPNLDIRSSVNPDVTIFSVYKPGAHNPGTFMGVWGNDNGDWDRFFLCTWGQGANGAASFGPGNPSAADVIGSGVVGVTKLLTAVYDGEVSDGSNNGPVNGSAMYFNGKLVTAFTDHTHPTAAMSSFRVGYDGDNSAFNGEIAEVIVYNRKLTDCEIQQVNLYLSNKYGEDFSTSRITLGSENNVICPKDSIKLTASAGASYKWLKDNVVIDDATDMTYFAKEAGKYRVVVSNLSGCSDSSAVVTLTKSETIAEITAAGPTSVCRGGTVELSATPDMASYKWLYETYDIGQYAKTTIADTDGNYYVEVTGNDGCVVKNELPVKVTIYPGPSTEITYSGKPEICQNDSIKLSAEAGRFDYQWYMNDTKIENATNEVFYAKEAGVYTISLKDENGCFSQSIAESELAVHVKVNALPDANVTSHGALSICNDSLVTLTAVADLDSYQWFRNGTLMSASNENQIAVGAAGVYTVRVTNAKGCASISEADQVKSVTMKPDLPVTVTIVASPATACTGTPVTFTASPVHGGTEPSYEWTVNNIVAGTNSSIFEISTLKPGDLVRVKVISNDGGCIINSPATSAAFTFRLNPDQDCDGDGIRNGLECPSGTNCGDKDGDGIPDYLDLDADNDGISDKEEGTNDCDRNGVPDYLDATTCNVDMMMPTLFTPNGDGVNDVIKIRIPGIITFGSLKIFNRWGNLVFETKDANTGWDGRLGGKLQPQDSYIWIATGVDRNNYPMTRKGIISLVR